MQNCDVSASPGLSAPLQFCILFSLFPLSYSLLSDKKNVIPSEASVSERSEGPQGFPVEGVARLIAAARLLSLIATDRTRLVLPAVFR